MHSACFRFDLFSGKHLHFLQPSLKQQEFVFGFFKLKKGERKVIKYFVHYEICLQVKREKENEKSERKRKHILIERNLKKKKKTEMKITKKYDDDLKKTFLY